MSIVFRYAWLFIIAGVIVNALVWRARMRRMEAEGKLAAGEGARFARGAAVTIIAPMLALMAIQLAAGWPEPTCVYSYPVTHPAVAVSWAVTAVAWGALLAWIWLGAGAETIGRASPALWQWYPGPALTPRQVRLGLTALLATVLIGMALVSSAFPGRPLCGMSAEIAWPTGPAR